VTGAISGDNRFILQKYFLQILAGISNADVVVDPSGHLVPGHEQRIPFQMTDADAGVDVILLTPNLQIVDFRLQTPTGSLLEPWRAIAEPRMAYVASQGVAFYRLVLPVELLPARFDQAGTWHALVKMIGRPRMTPPERPEVPRSQAVTTEVQGQFRRIVPPELRLAGTDPTLPSGPTLLSRSPADAATGAAIATGWRTVPYSLLVHSYSNLSLHASLDQSGWEPGDKVVIHASLAESGILAVAGAAVWVELRCHNRDMGRVPLVESDAGQFSGSFVASSAGVYQCRVRASGRTRAGHPFQREQTLTAAVWRGGKRDADPDHPRSASLNEGPTGSTEPRP
jgi:hypothetical protein